MNKNPDRLILGKGSSFVKSRLSRLPRTEEVWEADIQPISVWGWDARRHGELWLGMVLTRLEDFHLALLASEEAPTVNDLANLLAKAMERPWVMGARRPARILLRDNPQWQELIPHLGQLKIEVETQEELPLWDDAAAEYVRKLKASLDRTGRADHHGSSRNSTRRFRRWPAGSRPRGESRSESKRGRDSWSVPWTRVGWCSRARPASQWARL